MSIIWIPLLLTFLFVSCTAFGNFAHRLIGMLVWDRLDNCTKSALWKIIPRNRSLASLACYADTIKHESGMEWTQPLHFIDPYDDPPFYCGGVYSLTEPNVISAALNYTLQINRDWQHFAFAIHFLMDLHMPLHLTGKDRGGNGIKLIDTEWKRTRKVTLHYLLDSLIFHRIVKNPPFHGSYARFYQHLKGRRTHGPPCLDHHSLESCIHRWAFKTSQFNCRTLWEVPPDGTVKSYIADHQKVALKLLLRAADHIVEVLQMTFLQSCPYNGQ